MKHAVIFLFAGLLLVTIVIAGDVQTATYQNETIEITLRENTSCGLEENLFRVERLNYTTGDEATEIKYLQRALIGTEIVDAADIVKKIKKYSTTKTSYVNFSTNNTYNLTITIENQTLYWQFQGNCSIEQIIHENNTIKNNAVENETVINVTVTINNTINESLDNETIVLDESEVLNESEKESENNTNESYEEEIVCFEFAEIYTNKEVYDVGEKAEIQFYMRPISDSFTITYWIEDLEENIIKKSYTTTNLNEKSYTFKEINQEEKAYFLKAVFSDECGEREKSKLLVLQGEIKSESEQEEIQELESNIRIEEIEVNNQEARITLAMQKGDTAKSVINCAFTDNNGRKITPDMKIKLLTKYQEATISFTLMSEEHEEATITCEGLDNTIQQQILFPIIKQEKKEPTTKKEVAINTKETKKEVDITTLLEITNNEEETNEEKLTGFVVTSPKKEAQNNARNIIAGVLGIIVVGIIIAYKLSKHQNH